ncbi:MAG: hypothetical protein DSY80_10625 [Desulfocapsa sp.]|nr:MAG: hypothetical protein DSY80_10625 [Desulfocapsa sp.]
MPKAGGLDDQPIGLMQKLTICLNTYNAMRSYTLNRQNFAEWVEKYPSYMDIWLEIKRMRDEQ